MAEKWFEAAACGQFNTLCALAGTYLKSRDASGSTALMLVVQNNHTECLKLLEEEAGMVNRSGLTALALAIMSDNSTACAFLAPMEAHITLPQRSTPLVLAAKLGNCNAINCLAPYSEEPCGRGAETALKAAVRGNNFECVKTLLTRLPYTITDVCNELSTTNMRIKVLLLERCEFLLEYDMSMPRKSVEHLPQVVDQYQQRISFLKDTIHCLKEELQEAEKCGKMQRGHDPASLKDIYEHVHQCHKSISDLKHAITHLQRDKSAMKQTYEEKVQSLQQIYANTIGSMQMELQTLQLRAAVSAEADNKKHTANVEMKSIVCCTEPIGTVEKVLQTETCTGDGSNAGGNLAPGLMNTSQPNTAVVTAASCIQLVEQGIQTDAAEVLVLSADFDTDAENAFLPVSSRTHAQLRSEYSYLQQELLLKTAEVETLRAEIINLQASLECVSVTNTGALPDKDLEMEQEIQIFTERISALSEENLKYEQLTKALREDNLTLSEKLQQAESELSTAKCLSTSSADPHASLSPEDQSNKAHASVVPVHTEAEIQTDKLEQPCSVELGITVGAEQVEQSNQTHQTETELAQEPTNSSTGTDPYLHEVVNQSLQASMDVGEAAVQAEDESLNVVAATTVIRQELERAYQHLDDTSTQRESRTSMYTETVEKAIDADELGGAWCPDQFTYNMKMAQLAELEQLLKEKDDELALAHVKISQLMLVDKTNNAVQVASLTKDDFETTKIKPVACVSKQEKENSLPSTSKDDTIEPTPAVPEEEHAMQHAQTEERHQKDTPQPHTAHQTSVPEGLSANSLMAATERLCMLMQQLNNLFDTIYVQKNGTDNASLEPIKNYTLDILDHCTLIYQMLRESSETCQWNGPTMMPTAINDEPFNDQLESTNTDLMEAAILNNTEVASVFLSQVKRTNLNGDTALMIAAKYNSVDVAKLLVKDEANCVRKDGMTALTIALYNKNLEIAAFLREYEGINAKHSEESSDTSTISNPSALILAARCHDAVTVWCLLETHSRYQDEQGRTALMHAAEYGFDIIVHLLASYEASMKDKDGYTGLMIAASAGHAKVALELREYEARMQCARGYTALMYAAAAGQKDVVMVLEHLEAGMQTHAPDPRYLDQASQHGSPSDPDETVGITALMLAVEAGSVDCVDILWPLEHQITDSQGLSPIHYACSESMRNLLRSYQ